MTINDMHPTELIEHQLRQARANRNKIISDAKNDTDELTFSGSIDANKNAIAAKKNRDKLAELELIRLLKADDTSELELMMRDL